MKEATLQGCWYTVLRAAVDNDVTKRQIQLGQNVSDDVFPCGRNIIIEVCDALLKVKVAQIF